VKEIRKEAFTGQWVVFNSSLRDRIATFWKDRNYGIPKQTECGFCQGHEEETPTENLAYRRVDTIKNGPGWWVRAFENKGAVLQPDEELERRPMGIYDVTSGFGIHEIIVETENHITQLEELSFNQVRDVLWCFKDRIAELKKDQRFKYITVFKNFGLGTFGSMEHSHSQLLATPITPRKVKSELRQAKLYYADKERCLFCDVIRQENKLKERVVFETPHMIVLAPFASLSPYEMFIIPKQHLAAYEEMTPTVANDLTETLILALKKLAKLLSVPPYTIVIHTVPNLIPRPGYWSTVSYDFHWHIEISPRLYRMSGLEWGTGFYFNPIFPEVAAEELRNTII
jgi:UDPglucose--hexose-1-phosphate uridylyltransferase